MSMTRKKMEPGCLFPLSGSRIPSCSDLGSFGTNFLLVAEQFRFPGHIFPMVHWFNRGTGTASVTVMWGRGD